MTTFFHTAMSWGTHGGRVQYHVLGYSWYSCHGVLLISSSLMSFTCWDGVVNVPAPSCSMPTVKFMGSWFKFIASLVQDWTLKRFDFPCASAMARSMNLLPMVLLALGAWMLSSLTSQSGFVMNTATPRGSKMAMRGFKDDFYAWKETLSSEDQALLLKQAQNASWQNQL